MTKVLLENATTELPRYVSHKIVQAAAIIEIVIAGEQPAAPAGPVGKLRLDIGEGKVAVVDIEDGLFARYTPVVGDYVVIYNDGYVSISPKAKFDEGYTLATAQEAQPAA